MGIKKLAKKLARGYGVDLIRYNYQSSSAARLAQLLSRYSVNVVFDIGANRGQYGHLLRSIGYEGRIVSFEPLSTAYSDLMKIASDDKMWVCENVALGESTGNAEINISQNSESSSLLEMLPLHYESALKSNYIGKEKIEVCTVDDIRQKYQQEGERVFIKIDAQGFEGAILKGASKSMEEIVGIEIEMSFRPLYKGQMSFIETMALLDGKGFRLMSLEPVFFSECTGELLQVNGLFFRIE